MDYIIKETVDRFSINDVDDSYENARYIIYCKIDDFTLNFKVVSGKIHGTLTKYRKITKEISIWGCAAKKIKQKIDFLEITQYKNGKKDGFSYICKNKYIDNNVAESIARGRRVHNNVFSLHEEKAKQRCIGVKNISESRKHVVYYYGREDTPYVLLRKKQRIQRKKRHVTLIYKEIIFREWKDDKPNGITISLDVDSLLPKDNEINGIIFYRKNKPNICIGTKEQFIEVHPRRILKKKVVIFSKEKYQEFNIKRFHLGTTLNLQLLTDKNVPYLPPELVYEIIKKVTLKTISWDLIEYINLGDEFEIKPVWYKYEKLERIEVFRK